MIDYYFWPSSDWSYLGHARFHDLCEKYGFGIRYKPMRMVDLFARTGGILLGKRSTQRQDYRVTELKRWLDILQVKLNISPAYFPVDNEKALRLLAGAAAAGKDMASLVDAVMRAVWVEERDIADPATLVEIAAAQDIDAGDAMAWMASDAAGAAIDRNTDDAVAAGVFGGPSYVLNGEVFWGQDRLDQLEIRMRESAGQAVGDACGWRGVLKGVFVAELAGVEMESLSSARLIEGIGVEGDRYATAQGYYSHKPHEDRQVTLIEEETLDALKRDHGVELLPHETRRNLMTRGVPLNHLVGRRFRVGEVELYGGRLNVPCKYLERLLDRPLFDPLINRSGLNCRIIRGGTVNVGDDIIPID